MRFALVFVVLCTLGGFGKADAAGLSFGCTNGMCNCHGTVDCDLMVDKRMCKGPVVCDPVNPRYCHCDAAVGLSSGGGHATAVPKAGTAKALAK